MRATSRPVLGAARPGETPAAAGTPSRAERWRRPEPDLAVRRAVQQVATHLLPEVPDIGRDTAAYVRAAMPECADLGVEDLLGTSCHANSSVLVDALVRGVPLETMAPSEEVIQAVRTLARHDLDHGAVTRAYHLGATYWCTRWAQAVGQHNPHPALAIPVINAGTEFLLGWLAQATGRLSDEHQAERDRIAREWSLARVLDVRRLLTDDDADPRALSVRLGYDVSAQHVALVLRHRGGDDGHALDEVARELVDVPRSLVVRVSVDTAWIWTPAADYRGPVSFGGRGVAGAGRRGAGLDGFRQTHREALEALRVARLTDAPEGTITAYDDVEIAALCSAEARLCGEFVARELGELAESSDHVVRLRVTLTTFFETNGNYKLTAAKLGVHENTVRNRLNQIETRLGRWPTSGRRLQLEVALHLAARLGTGGRSPVRASYGTMHS